MVLRLCRLCDVFGAVGPSDVLKFARRLGASVGFGAPGADRASTILGVPYYNHSIMGPKTLF